MAAEATFDPEVRLTGGWASRVPDERDIAVLAELRAAVTRRATGLGAVDVAPVLSEVTEAGSWTRRQRVALDPSGRVRAWASAHDRAAGRALVQLTVDPALDDGDADAVAAALLTWVEEVSHGILAVRHLDVTQLDAGAYADDPRQSRWLAAAGYVLARRWLQMRRPVTARDLEPGALPAPRPGVSVRRVERRANGLPVARDVQLAHRVLEESFADHFNSYRESFPEFVHRLMENPGHTWDHWWLAFVEVDGAQLPGGALVSTVLPPDADGVAGSYVDYLGVHRRARGRGVAKTLLGTVIADTAARGRHRLGLEVDADSPTHADGLYRALGWDTAYVTQSWHRDLRR
ncbi:GNAT family N-acetyltransferase [Georgenia sp. SYP-B2076]|uniref:GNAT family N-acetyltransferase n=1 Tax=Georgenia sp. SYP-B2076 TaxID=2495881 RepID=UPI000F8DB37B|nr:GNAT family N-acetyltransferase [Georgenia sp. SYP-B2076]